MDEIKKQEKRKYISLGLYEKDIKIIDQLIEGKKLYSRTRWIIEAIDEKIVKEIKNR